LVIGNDFLTGTRPFDGLIDEPAIYNAALSAAQVQAIFNSGTAGKCKPTATVSPSGQVGWWSGDGNANDIAGANNGTLQNGAGFAVGKVGQGFQFNGAMM
jgi:Concanavalin A-like lectin/glucanases superfamily